MMDGRSESNGILELIRSGKLDDAHAQLEKRLAESPDDESNNFLAGVYLIEVKNAQQAEIAFRKAINKNDKNIASYIYLCFILRSKGTPQGNKECSDIISMLLENYDEQIKNYDQYDMILHIGAMSSYEYGLFERALQFFSKLVALNGGSAEDHFNMSEIYALLDRLSEAAASLRKAIELDPDTYAKSLHLESLQRIESSFAEGRKQSALKRHKYPTTEIFQGDLKSLIIDHIAVEHKNAPKFISKETVFFTMGSCFARNLSRSILKKGYPATHMAIAEHINTTFANRYFVDWLADKPLTASVRERIEELMPPELSREEVLTEIKRADVFILTLGVAPVFFDRQTGEFVMPRPTNLNTRSLAEKYEYKTTTVAQNVDNLMYFFSFIRSLNPTAKFIVTLSPVPLMVTFEFDSAVVADCLSKSTLRLVAQDVVHHQGLKNIYYWPSFEVFRWAGGHAGPYFGTDDGLATHVAEGVVDSVIGCFLELFSVPGSVPETENRLRNDQLFTGGWRA